MPLAQLNIAKLLAPIDSPQLKDFVEALDHINALAEQSPGFIWRLKDDTNNATGLRPFDDNRLIVNMSLWDSVNNLRHYVYKTAHAEYLGRRKEWFSLLGSPHTVLAAPHTVLWWVAPGHIPSLEEAKMRLEQLQKNGPSREAFGFSQVFPEENSY